MGRKVRLWMLLAATFLFMVLIPQRVQAETDPVEVTVKLDACKGHEAIAKAIAGQEYEQTGTVVTIPLRHSELYPDDGYSTNGSMQLAAMVLSNKVRSAFEDPDTGFEDVIDNGEHLVYLGYNYIVGLREMQRYSAWDEINSDFSNDPVSEGQMFYLLWEKPAKSVTVTVKPQDCGTKIELVKQDEHCIYSGYVPHTHPWPEITISGNAKRSTGTFMTLDGLYTNNTEGNNTYGLDYEGVFNDYMYAEKEDYFVLFYLEADFGYYLGTTKNNNIKVNGKAPVYVRGDKVVAYVPAEHVPGNGIITEAFCEVKGKKVYTCSGCGKEITEEIPAIGHAWKFNSFTWTGNEKDGYTKAAAEYVCEHDQTHKTTVDAELKETVTAPGCLTKGKSTFTVSVSAQKSPDGKAHSESKEGRPTEAAGHTWKAPIFTWTTDGQGGYSGVEATFVCKKDSTHKVSVKAEVTSRKVNSECEAAGMTLYTATVPAKASPDGKEYTDQTGAEITDPTGHTWKFAGFTWTGNQAKGYTKATANYVCRRDPLHKYSVKAVITKKVTAPTKEKDGRTVYTAKVSETKSPDGKKHSETKNGLTTVWKASGLLFAEMTAQGDTSLKLTWNKIKGAGGYDIFLGRCNFNDNKVAVTRIGTIKGNKTFQYTTKNLKKATPYKACVKAWIKKNGKIQYVKTSPAVHAYTAEGNANYTNTRGVKLKKTKVTLKTGEKYTIEATPVRLDSKRELSRHMTSIRYVSSNSKIAAVSKEGEITAKKAGSCKIYVIAANGAKKAMTVKVK